MPPSGWRPAAPPAGVDLDVTYISREPAYRAYCVVYPDGIPVLCPGTEGEQRWPAAGEVVTFTAHIVNKGTIASPPFDFRWWIDGVETAAGALGPLAPGAGVTASLPWAWAHVMDGERVVDDHTVRFEIDPADAVAETYENNNSLEDRTNALAFRIGITPAMVAAYDAPWNPAFSFSAEDWLQRQVAAMNWDFENSTYAAAPLGATERVRIDRIEVTDTAPPNIGDSDGGWFVDADYRLTSGGYDPRTDIDWALVHELSHQVGIIDLYQYGVMATSVLVTDREGFPANIGFAWPRPGLMGGGDIAPHTDPHLYSSHTAAGFNTTKGFRRGYYGEYQFDIPYEIYVRVLDSQGNPAEGVMVSLYQRNGPADWNGDLAIDDVPEIAGRTGPDGRFELPNRSVGGLFITRTRHMLHGNPFGPVDVVGRSNRFLVKLARGQHEEFGWLDMTTLNLAYWAGDTLVHTVEFPSHVPPLDAPARPAVTPAHIEGSSASFCWNPSGSPGVIGYNVYRAAAPAYAYARVSGPVAALCFTESYAAGNRVYAVTAVADSSVESAFSNFIWAPRLTNPAAVGLASDGTRVILDPQNGYALLRQRDDGRYVGNFGSPHYHLEFSRFLAVSPLDWLIFSHPGDYYTGRHSVRVADRAASPLFEIGQQGAGPGQFQNPAGVAVWQGPCAGGGACPNRILVADSGNHRIQAFGMQGEFAGAVGSYGASPGQFRFPQGLAVDAGGRVIVADQGNNRLQIFAFDGADFTFAQAVAAAFDAPVGVATASGGRIVVADTGHDQIKVLDASGALIGQYDMPDDGSSGRFSGPQGVAVQGSVIIVADTGNRRIVTLLGALPALPPTETPTPTFTPTATLTATPLWQSSWLPLVLRQ